MACEPLATSWVGEEKFPIDRAETIEVGEENPQRLKVMTWNVKFGGARINFYWDYWGDRVHMTSAEVQANMDEVNALIRQTGGGHSPCTGSGSKLEAYSLLGSGSVHS